MMFDDGQFEDSAHGIAYFAAALAYNTNFSSHRGVEHWEDVDVLVVYNNHPYANDPDRRTHELAAFGQAMRQEGIRELSFASYPTEGDSAGYTFALVLDASRDRIGWVTDTWEEILRRR